MKKLLGYLGAVLLCACSGETVPTNNLEDTEWVLTAFQEPSGVKTAPQEYFTLHFLVNNKISGQTFCGNYSADYETTDNKLISIVVARSVQLDSACQLIPPNTEYLDQLKAAKSYVKEDENLSLDLADGRKLMFNRKFVNCANPLPVAGTPNPGPFTASSVVTIKSSNVDELVQNLEANNPDFIIQASKECSNTIVARVNPNTLAQLRCNTAVDELSYGSLK